MVAATPDDTQTPPPPAKRRSRATKASSTATTPATTRKKATAVNDTPIGSKASDVSLKGLLGAQPRQTLPSNANILGALNWGYLPRRQYAAQVDLATLPDQALSPQQLMELLADASPEVSAATWNLTRLGASEWTYEVRSPNSTTGDTAGKALLDALLARVNPLAGGFAGLLAQWMQSVVLEGAACGECIPTADFTGVFDLVPVQPWTIFFRRDVAQELVPLQWQPMLASGAIPDVTSGPPQGAAQLLANPTTYDRFDGFRVLNTETFGYVALDPFIDDPYGRLPFASVVQMLAFEAQLYKDLRQWSHTHAWGRLDVSLLAERIEAVIPARIKANPAERLAFRDQYLNAIKTAYAALNPDDTFVHYDDVTVSGISEAGQTFAIDNLIKIVERSLFRALRQLPILMGSNEGTTETWGTLQLEVYALGVQSLQAVVGQLVTHLLTTALHLFGSTSVVEFTFKKMRSTDRIKDEAARKLQIANEATVRDEGWQSQDEASIAVTGSKSVAPAPQPDNPYLPAQPDAAAAALVAAVAAATPPAEPDAAKEKPPSTAPADAAKPATKSAASVYADALARALSTLPPEPPPEGPPEPPTPSRPPTTTPQARQAVTRAADHAERTTAQRAAASALTTALRAHFAATTISEATLRHLMNLHSRAATAPKTRRAQRAPTTDAPQSNTPQTLTPDSVSDERAALIASIVATLAADVQDADTALTRVLSDAWLATWAAGARHALTSLGVSAATAKTFALTNMGVLGRIAARVRQQVAGLQLTTRERLATVIADDVAGGQPLATITADVRGALDRMATGGPAGGDTTAAAESAADSAITSRAETIAETETSSAWHDGLLQTAQRNGGQTKTWVTTGDPDPHSKSQPCADNEDAGPLALDDTFPSGDDAPPAHTNCRCQLDISPLEDVPAADDLWLGD